MEREFLEQCLGQGMSSRQIEKLVSQQRNTILYWIHKYGLEHKMKYQKQENLQLDKIDTKEKAYFLGFVLADGAIAENGLVEVSVAMSDKEIPEAISKWFGGHVAYDKVLDRKARRFPRARWSRKVKDIKKFTGGNKKQDRHYPIIRADLERYMLQGLFDGDGSISWGCRKSPNDKTPHSRVWQKVSITSQYKILCGVQQYLIKKLGISSSIRQKKDEKCFVLEICNKNDVMTFLNHIYPSNSFIILQRKYSKYCALRLELEGNGGTSIIGQYRAEPAEQEGVETSGAVARLLNNHISIQGETTLRYSPNWAH